MRAASRLGLGLLAVSAACAAPGAPFDLVVANGRVMDPASGLDAVRFSAHLEQVRDELVGALSSLPDAGSVAVVARELSAVR